MKDHTKAWGKQKELQKQPTPKPERILYIIETIQHKETQALTALLYLLGCRITEVLGEKRRTFWEREWEKITNKRGEEVTRRIGPYTKSEDLTPEIEPLTIHNFETKYRNGVEFMMITLTNRKNKKRDTKIIPINLSDDVDAAIWKIIETYKEYRKSENKEKLFDFGKSRGYALLAKHTGFNPHWLRHVRLTHLVTKYDLNERFLIKYAGWTDGRPAEGYMELNPTDLMDAFIK